MWTSLVEVPSNVDTAHIGRYLATLEGTSGTLQVCRYAFVFMRIAKCMVICAWHMDGHTWNECLLGSRHLHQQTIAALGRKTLYHT